MNTQIVDKTALCVVKLAAVDILPTLLRRISPCQKWHVPEEHPLEDSVWADGQQVLLSYLSTARFVVPSIKAVIDVPDILHLYMFNALEELSDEINKTLSRFSSKALLVTSRIPKICRCPGELGEYAEFTNFGALVKMLYNPGAVSQEMAISVLYGISEEKPSEPKLDELEIRLDAAFKQFADMLQEYKTKAGGRNV